MIKRTLTSDYNDGLNMLNEISKKKALKWCEDNDYIIGLKKVNYIYATKECKEEHIQQMLKEGWEIEDNGDDAYYIYTDQKDSSKNIEAQYASFSKVIPNIYGEIYENEEDMSIESLIESRDIRNFFDINVFNTFFKCIGDEEIAVKKAITYKDYINSTKNRYPEIIMRFLRHIKYSNEYDFEKDNEINNIDEQEVFTMLEDFQNASGNLSKSVLDWVEYKFDKKLN